MKVVGLSDVRTGRLYSPGNIPGTHFCWSLSQPQGHSAAGRIMSMKNSNDTIGNRTRDLPACNTVPQPTARSPTPYPTVPSLYFPYCMYRLTSCLEFRIHCHHYGVRTLSCDVTKSGERVGPSQLNFYSYLHPVS